MLWKDSTELTLRLSYDRPMMCSRTDRPWYCTRIFSWLASIWKITLTFFLLPRSKMPLWPKWCGQSLSHSQLWHIRFLFSSGPSAFQQQPISNYNIQSTTTLVSGTSVFSLSVNIIISHLTILEFIFWTTNLRKQLHKNLKYDT
jgi:hypothetical protein